MKRSALSICFALLAALALSAQANAANLLGNPSFETPDASGGDVNNAPGAPWAGFNDPNVRFTSQAEARTGLQSVKTFGPFDFIGGGVGYFQAVAATAGQTYSGDIWVKQQSGDALAGGNFGVFKIEFLDGSGQLVDVGSGPGTPVLGVNFFESVPFNGASPVDAWVKLGTGGVAPAGTVSAQAVGVQVQLGDGQGGFTGGAIFWDDARLDVAQIPEPASLALLGLGALGMTRSRRR